MYRIQTSPLNVQRIGGVTMAENPVSTRPPLARKPHRYKVDEGLDVRFLCHANSTHVLQTLWRGLFLVPAFVVAVLGNMVFNFYNGGFAVLLGQFGTSVLGLSEAAIGVIILPSALFGALGSILAGRLIPKYTNRFVGMAGLLILAAASITMSFASPTMSVWVLALVYVLLAGGCAATQTSTADVILGTAPPDRIGAVSAIKSTTGMTGYTLGPTIFILLLNVFFSRAWLGSAEARGLTD